MNTNAIRLLAYAKLNLALDIVARREDGYHTMDMVNRSVDLWDDIYIAHTAGSGLFLRSNARHLPLDRRNLVYQAAEALCAETNTPLPALSINIVKRIPSQAGLGGGSADAAATLVGLNALLGFGLSAAALCEIGARIGADIPFCIVGGTARVCGIGEIVTPVEDKCDYSVVILMPSEGRSTREAFAAFDEGGQFLRPDISALLECLREGDTAGMAMHMCNVFQTADAANTSDALAAQLLARGALGASLTGSGAAVFGVFSNNLQARRCCTAMRARGFRAFISRPVDCGVKILHAPQNN